MRTIKRIIIHATATPEGRWFDVDEIRKMHLQRGFKDIGYHYVVMINGCIETGRPVEKPGAHTMGYNSDSIGISYIGGIDASGKAKDTRTPEQKKALLDLVNILLKKYPDIQEIAGHRDYSPDLNGDGKITPDEWVKICPCFSTLDEFGHLIKQP